MSSPAIYGGSRTKILTSKGLLLKDGTPIDYNGQKNYITKGTFATNATTGWNLKRTTLSNKIPNQVAASWTTPSVLTLSATSTGALTQAGFSLSLSASGVTTAGDMLVSDSYTIDIEDQAKTLAFKFSYKAYTNPTNLVFAGNSTNTFHVYIYDDVNSAWIQPAGCYSTVQSSGVGIATGTFQTPANMTSFRIAIVSCNASLNTTGGGAFTMYFDNFSVGPQITNMGVPVTDWVSYTPTISGGGTANPTDFYWRRVGGNMEIKGLLKYPSVVPTGVVKFTVPSGYNLDKSKLPAGVLGTEAYENIGIGTFYDSSADARQTGSIICDNTSTNTFYVQGAYTSASPWGTTANGITVAANDAFEYTLTVPISGWSSNTVMSSDLVYSDDVGSVHAFAVPSSSPPQGYLYADGSAISRVQYYDLFNKIGTTYGSGDGSTTFNLPDLRGVFVRGAGSQTISGQTYTGTLGTKQGDQMQGHKHNGTSAVVNSGGSAANPGTFLNGGPTSPPPVFATNNGAGYTTWDMPSTGYPTTDGTNGTPRTGTQTHPANISLTYFIKYVKGSVANIAASEPVAAVYTTNAGMVAATPGTAKTVDFEDKVEDTHNAVTTGANWKFTAPVSGLYDITVLLSANTNTSTAFAFSDIIIYKGASTQLVNRTYPPQLSTTIFSSTTGRVVRLLAGEYISISWNINYNSGAPSLWIDGAFNIISIKKVGN